MKKNAMLKIAAILMVAVLLTTCAISSTFAKYTTSDNDTVTAQVAKWGVKLDVNIQGLFAKNYAKDTAAFDKADNTVVAYGEYNLVAPGTTKSINVTADVSGKPEVAFAVTTTAVLLLDGWSDGTGEYCPLVFTVAGEDYYIGKNSDITSIATLITAVQDAIKTAGSAMYAANTELTEDGTATKACDFDIAWRWEYEKNTVPSQDDVKDTYLGNQAAGSPAIGDDPTADDYVAAVDPAPAKVSLKITQTIDQIN